MKRIIVAIPHSHTWFLTQTCVSALRRHPPAARDCEYRIVVVDNSWDWSPSIRGITNTSLGEDVDVIVNLKANKFHATALDHVIERYDFDYLMAMETDVIVLRSGWMQWFLDQMQQGVAMVGQWHHEQFINPSCTLYRGEALRKMANWCKKFDSDVLRWGEDFEKTAPLGHQIIGEEASRQARTWIAAPFAEKRGWPEGTKLANCPNRPSGQTKGPGWYEPGQQLYHWAMENGWVQCNVDSATYCKSLGMPVQTLYGVPDPGPDRQLSLTEMNVLGAWAVHLWGGTRALDILKHPVEDPFVNDNMAFWLDREVRLWREIVDEDAQQHTIDLVRRYGWHLQSFFGGEVTDREREAAKLAEAHYRNAGLFI